MGADQATPGFWSENQPGFRFSESRVGTPAFFLDVEAHRYALEPHILEVVDFPSWNGSDVLEVGCGIATDGARFARAGARYTGLDSSAEALELARARFGMEDLTGSFLGAPATALPFDERSFDLVYSHGVIHHVEDTRRAVEEFRRVLRPGGTALVMLYHRNSFNYRFTVSVLRRLMAAVLLVPGSPAALNRLTREPPAIFEGHRDLLRRHGLRYLTDNRLWLSNNTDGPGNPLSKVYSRQQARELFAGFVEVRCAVRFLNLRAYPRGERLEASSVAKALGQRVGWHLYVRASRPGASALS